MAVARAVSYSGPSGSVIRGGRFGTAVVSGAVTLDDAGVGGGFGVAGTTVLSGGVSLDSVGVAGGFASQVPPVLSGSITLDDAMAAGGSALAWQFADGATLNTGRSTTTVVATGVPADATYYASPDLLPGQSLQLSGSTLSIVGDYTVPTVNGASSGSVLDIVSDRDVTITVLPSPMARARNLRYPLVWWGEGESSAPIYGLTNGRSRLVNVFNAEYGTTPAISGDTIEISPGAIALPGDGTAFDGTGGYAHITCSLTVKGIDGAGRFRMLPIGAAGSSGIEGFVVHRPGAARYGERITLLLQDFVCDNLGSSASPISMRRNADIVGSFAPYLASVTVRNFKFFNPSGTLANSGVSGMAELLTLEDGSITDFGNGSGQEHNLYCSARVMTLRGIRTNRTRGWAGVPYSSSTLVEGHLAKLEAEEGLIEGCSFDGADAADHSLMLQIKAGGNWVVQGNLFKDSPWANVHNGAINMCREIGGDGVTPNFKWFAGRSGNSLVFRRNAFIGAMARPPIWFFPQTHINAMRPATGGSYTDAERLSSLVVEDNVGMVPSTMRNGVGSLWVLAGWTAQAADKPMWINQDPNAGPSWGTRGNVVVPYDQTESAFIEREILSYRSAAGPVAASGGTLTTRRFTWPHGSIARTDAYKGLA